MKNRVRIVIWVVSLIIIAIIAIRGFRYAHAPVDPVEPDSPTTPVFSEEPVTMTAYLEIIADRPVRAYIGDTDITDPGTKFEVKPGIRAIVLKDEEGNEIQTDLIVIGGDTNELRQRVVLQAEKKSITFITGMEDCDLYIDGVFDSMFHHEIGLILPLDSYVFEIRKEGYQPLIKEIVLDEETPWEIEVKLLPVE